MFEQRITNGVGEFYIRDEWSPDKMYIRSILELPKSELNNLSRYKCIVSQNGTVKDSMDIALTFDSTQG